MSSAPGTAFETFSRQRFFASLDGLRALSVIAVIWHHTSTGLAGGAWSHAGAHGVTLFFAISGFLITTLLLREVAQHGAIDMGAFYVRRSLRIFPLYYAVLGLYVLVVWAVERDSPQAAAFWRNLPYFLTYTSNLFVSLEGRVIFYFSWSLAAEEQFYLIWPSLLRLLHTKVRAGALLAVVLVGASILQGLQVAGFLAFPVAIVAGSLLAIILSTPAGHAALWPWLGHRLSAPALSLLFLALTTQPYAPMPAIHLSASLLVIACVLREDHGLAALLQLPPLVYWGKISYGMYLLHMLCKNVGDLLLRRVGYTPSALEIFLACLVLTTLVASLSFRYFETPILRCKTRFAR